MKKPIIGITPDYSYEKTRFKISEDYTNALLKAGGVPVLLFPGEDFPDFVDGILFTGGGDIDPLRFGEEPIRQNGQISPLRDEYELSLCKEAMKRNLPLFGVCRGMQIMNIAAGGGTIRISKYRRALPSSTASRHPVPTPPTALPSFQAVSWKNFGGLQRLLSIPCTIRQYPFWEKASTSVPAVPTV